MRGDPGTDDDRHEEGGAEQLGEQAAREGRLGERGHGDILTRRSCQSVKIESMNSEQTAELVRRARVHAALGDVHRLRIVDLLATTDASSSELGAALGLPSNLLAHHLKTPGRAQVW